jgi:uroporphyrinogen decarboxylase
VGEKTLTPKELSELFGRPFMGGLDRKGIIVDGSAEQIRQEVHDVLVNAGDRHIVGADCTLPGDIAWENIRTAIAAAHDFRG